MRRGAASAFLFFIAAAVFAEAPASIQWQPSTDSLFESAKKQNKLVILDLEAVWCHWCHVMDELTYSDPKVKELIGSGYIAVRVDQDSRPDLSNRYEDYGWPATIIFSPSGQELVKRSGYIPPGPMASLLQAVVDDPTPGPSIAAEEKFQYAASGQLDPALKKKLEGAHLSFYDDKRGGWGKIHKYIDADSLEYALFKAAGGDAKARAMAEKTLEANLALIDPAWGGVYQYSVEGWNEPHFEKIMQYQAGDLRIYSLAYSLWRRPADLNAAKNIQIYLAGFLLSPEGAFYTSQDADLVKGEHSADYFALSDAERRKKGIPAVDKHIYSRENGWAVEALAAYYSVTTDPQILDQAETAAKWILMHRAITGGGFRHDETDKAGPYLGDTLAMGRAFLALYQATADPAWLDKAMQSAEYIAKTFRSSAAGYATAISATAGFQPRPQRDENAGLARFANLLFHYTGNKKYGAMASHAMRFIATPQVAEKGSAATVLLADLELSNAPLHLTVVGPKTDDNARQLFLTGLAAFPLSYKRIEWWDRAEGKLINPDVSYPELPQAAAFLCANGRCSLPFTTPDKLKSKLNKIP